MSEQVLCDSSRQLPVSVLLLIMARCQSEMRSVAFCCKICLRNYSKHSRASFITNLNCFSVNVIQVRVNCFFLLLHVALVLLLVDKFVWTDMVRSHTLVSWSWSLVYYITDSWNICWSRQQVCAVVFQGKTRNIATFKDYNNNKITKRNMWKIHDIWKSILHTFKMYLRIVQFLGTVLL